MIARLKRWLEYRKFRAEEAAINASLAATADEIIRVKLPPRKDSK